MGNSGTINIKIVVDGQGGIKVLKEVGDESQKTGKKGEKSFSDMGSSVGDFEQKTASLKGMLLGLGAAVGGVYLIKQGFDALIATGKESVALANIQEAAETKLGATLKATGYAAGYSLEQLKAMAGGMQDLTTTGDEVTLSAMAVLTTFKQIRGEGFERSTKAALDMQAVMGGPLQSSIVMIGKALNDPIANLSAMTRAGVQFTDQQKEQIKTMWEAGDVAGAQNVILKELESQFGGVAAAIRKTFGGSVDAAKNKLGDLKEEVGFSITKNEAMIQIVQDLEKEFQNAIVYIQNNSAAIEEWVNFLAESIRVGRMLAKTLLELGAGAAKAAKIVSESMVNEATALIDVKKEVDANARSYVNYEKDLAAGNAQIEKMLANQKKSTKAHMQNTEAVKPLSKAVKSLSKEEKDALELNKKIWGEKVKTAIRGDKEMADAHAYYSKYEIKLTKDQQKEEKKLHEDSIKLMESELNLKDRLLSGMMKKDQDYFTFKKTMLDNELEKYKGMYGDLEYIKKAFAERYKQLEWEQARASEDFFAGVKAGYAQLTRDQLTWGEAGYQMVKGFADNSRKAVSDILFDGIKGDMNSFGEYYQTFMDSMLRLLVDMLAQSLIEWALYGQTVQAMQAAQATGNVAAGAAGAAAAGATTTLPSGALAGGLTSWSINPVTGALIGVGGGTAIGQAMGADTGTAFVGSAGGAALGGWLAAGTALGGPLGAVIGGLAGGVLSGIVDDVGDFFGDAADFIGDFFGGFFHGGGVIKAHRGMFVGSGIFMPPLPDERDIRVLIGEGILNRGAVQRIGGEAGVNALNRGANIIDFAGRDESSARQNPAEFSEIKAEIRALRADLQSANYTIARNTLKMAKTLDKFDYDGMPAVRS